jgi:hypothetical protein
MLTCATVSASTSIFTDLDRIANDKAIAFNQAVVHIDSLFERSIDPVFVKRLIIYSAEQARSFQTWDQKKIYERYDEAIFIGICRLVNLNTAESVRQLVDLINLDLGVSNNEIIGQRITEIGHPALEHLDIELRKLRNKEKTSNQETEKLSSMRIRRIESYIKHIKEGKKSDVGVGPCSTQ